MIWSKFELLIRSLLKQLNETNAIEMIFNFYNTNEIITFITKKEAEEIIPSALWKFSKSNTMRFASQEGSNICKKISENILSKKIVIRKIEDDIIEINLVIPDNEYLTQDYNILNKDSYEKLKERYSWPVYDCIWKPKCLWINSNITNKNHPIKYEDLTEETTEEILKIQLDDCVKEIRIIKNIDNLASIRNLFKIAKKFTLVKILVGIWYKFDESDF